MVFSRAVMFIKYMSKKDRVDRNNSYTFKDAGSYTFHTIYIERE